MGISYVWGVVVFNSRGVSVRLMGNDLDSIISVAAREDGKLWGILMRNRYNKMFVVLKRYPNAQYLILNNMVV